MSSNIIPRQYQIDFFNQAKQENVIIVAETGSGKTLVAQMLIDHIINELKLKKEKKFIIFMAPTVDLCTQQHQKISKNKDYSVRLFYGELIISWRREKWLFEYNQHSVFVMTPQILLDNLSNAILNISQIALLVFDECHHTVKNTPYNRIMKEFYHNSSIKPKILGLTASPISSGVKKSNQTSKQLKLCKDLSTSLDAKIIEASESLKVESFASHPEEIIEYYSPPSTCYTNQIQQTLSTLPNIENNKSFFSKESLQYVIDCLGPWSTVHFVQLLLQKIQQYRYSMYFSDYDDHISYLNHLYQPWKYLLNQAAPNSPHDISFQAIHLIEILSNHISSLSQDQQICIIVFVQTRYTAHALTHLLNSLRNSIDKTNNSLYSCSSFCRNNAAILERGKSLFALKNIQASALVSKNSTSNLSSAESNKVILDKFNNGLVQILVATSVAEEGLDVQPCKLVVRFQEIQTLVSYVQTRGRARHLSAQYIVLQYSENNTNKFQEIKDCERLMKQVISKPITRTYEITELGPNEIYRVDSTGATVSLHSAISLIYQYCNTLSNEKYTTLSPTYLVSGEEKGFSFKLFLPKSSPITFIQGEPEANKMLAKQSVSLKACILLYENNELDEYLKPRRRENLEIINTESQSECESQSQLQNTNQSTIINIWTIPTKVLHSWNEIQLQKGILLNIYSLSCSTNQELLYVLSTLDLFSSKKYTEITFQLRYESTSPTFTLKPYQTQHFSYSELQSLQRTFNSLLSNIVETKYLSDVQNQSTYLSPIMIKSNVDNNFNTNNDNIRSHPLYSSLLYILNELEVILNLQCFELTTNIQFHSLHHLNIALTAPSTQLSYNYNRYETFGDAFLKFITSLYLYDRYPDNQEGVLSNLKDQIISNSRLTEISNKFQLSNFMRLEQFSVKNYLPVGYNSNLYETTNNEKLNRVSEKMNADIVESIIGAYYDDCERNPLLTWYNVINPFHIISSSNLMYPSLNNRSIFQSNLKLKLNDSILVQNIEEILGYQFQEPNLVLIALTHPSYQQLLVLNHLAEFESYQRLEFLGDPILGLIITEFLFDWSPKLSSAKITDWRSCITSNEYLGVVAIKTGLYEYIHHYSDPLRCDIDEYKRALQTQTDWNNIISIPSIQRNNRFFYSSLNPPKVLADIIESLIAAIFIDSHGNIEVCRQVISSLILQPDIIPLLSDDLNDIWGFQKHPISIVHEIVSSFHCHQVKFNYSSQNKFTNLHTNNNNDSNDNSSDDDNNDNNNTNNNNTHLFGSTNNNNNNNNNNNVICNIICHNQVISTGYGNNKKRARLSASIQLNLDRLTNFLHESCDCH